MFTTLRVEFAAVESLSSETNRAFNGRLGRLVPLIRRCGPVVVVVGLVVVVAVGGSRGSWRCRGHRSGRQPW